MANDPTTPLSIAEALEGKRILLTGSTGFVGKVALSMLLHRYPRVGKVYPLVRPTLGQTAQTRFFDKVAPSPAFDPLRAIYDGAYDEFMRGKVEPLSGDVTEPDFEIDAATIERLVGKVDAIVNVAGLVSFNPALDTALRINTIGARYAAELALKLDAALVHVSTCFVAGNRDGAIWENDPVWGYMPRQGELDDKFEPDAEIADCERTCAEVRARAEDRQLGSMFRERARKRLREEGRDPDDERTVKLAAARERKLWIGEQLTDVGMKRAQHWGWPNIYCYTKSLGDQVVAQAGRDKGLRYAIVRPAIVESSLEFPMAGWNEGMTTSAPLAFMSLKGHSSYPAGDGTFLDVIPVDMVAAGIIAVTGATLARQNEPVYQMGSSDTNPLTMARTVELVGLHRRRWFKNRETGPRLLNEVLARYECVPVSRDRWDNLSAPAWRKLARGASDWLDKQRPAWGAPRVESLIDRAQQRLARVERVTRETQDLIELFMPFIYERKYVFRCDNMRALYARMAPADRAALRWAPEILNWRTYWLDVHMEGLKKWVFPSLEEQFQEKPKSVYQYRDLLEMFESAAKRFRSKVAMRMLEEGGAETRYTYGEIKRLADVAGGQLVALGVKPGEKILLVSENRPEWSIAYFGVLKAGGVCVPVDPQLTPAEIDNVARSAGATRAITSDTHAARCETLTAYRFEQLLQPGPVPASTALVPVGRPDDLASLIYTSGTTGTPKGVMLSHRNFTALISRLQSVFGMRSSDGLLSVLPLHHTFEFTAGLLMPISRGAEVTYIGEIVPERLREAMSTGRITALVGVPALWQSLARKITGEIDDRGNLGRGVVRGLLALHRELRSRTPLNLGKLVFAPVHKKFGGRIRMMISGGSALAPDIMKLFHGLGFSLYEGYGLTEAAPVLTAMRPSNKLLLGTVGEPLPGVQVRIHEPDATGVGEVIAHGPNVMAGYYQNPEATAQVLKDGWLHTGDLGTFDADGRLRIVGRKKDVIIDANGKNVYPDELEELYGDYVLIKELSVVGLPDGDGGETIAALVVPDYAKDESIAKGEVRGRVTAHMNKVSAGLPFYKRVKVMHLWDGELPRTATRKVKRKLVVAEIERLERTTRVVAEGLRRLPDGRATAAHGWLLDAVAQVANRPRATVNLDSRFADLGYDSLMYTELGVALEAAGATVPEDITGIQTVRDLAKLATREVRGGRAHGARTHFEQEAVKVDEAPEIAVPESVQRLGKRLLTAGQRFAYERILDTRVIGRAHVPPHGRFVVAANHASHLDMGLCKHALGDCGKNLVAMAAKDYFFDHPVRGAYFKNFTNLIPMERQGSMKESLRQAAKAIEEGYILLLFPEGTRSTTGVMTDFKPSLGYLALTNKVDVLPMYLEGTHDALPKGAAWLKERKIAAHIGPVITYAELKRRTEGMPKSEAYRAAAALVEAAVCALRDRKPSPVAGPRPPAPKSALPVVEAAETELPAAHASNGKHKNGNGAVMVKVKAARRVTRPARKRPTRSE
jgi:long-chain acyl-CoA synthetase